jgi:2-polyprenyl-3-methyl-5-hydroxy-6-metoxy-1,4-benzoquinol methylase
MKSVTSRFELPPKGALSPNGVEDPLKYYYKPLISKLFIHRVNIVLQLLGEQCFSNTLEIGYGSGVLLPSLCKISDRVYGVDIGSDPEFVSRQLHLLGCHPILSTGSPKKLLFENDFFELVVAVSVLEHIAEIQDFLAEIHRVLKPGGYLLVGMPAVNKFMEYLFQLIGFSGIQHHHVTSPEDMHRAARTTLTLRSSSWMPSFLPFNLYLYKAFLYQK